MRIARILSAAALAGTTLAFGLITAAPAGAAEPDPFAPVTVTFGQTAHYVWTAPPGVYRVAVHLVGGSGGSGAAVGSAPGGTGGFGGTVDAVVNVQPGQTLTADLGGRGQDAAPSSALAARGGQQVLGFTGGSGGTGFTGGGTPRSSGGGGGAASTLVIGNVIQATAGGGGGGGGAGGGFTDTTGGSGGAAGQSGGGAGGGTPSTDTRAGGDGGTPSVFSSVPTAGGGGGGGGFRPGLGGRAFDSGQGAGGGAGGGTDVVLSGTVGTDTVVEDGWASFTPRPGLDPLSFFLTAGAVSTAVHHSPLIISAAVTAAVSGAPAPTGIISFFDTSIGFLGNATIAGGRADLHIDTLPVGSHTIVAHYGGDSTYLPTDVPGAQTVTVTPAPGRPTPSATAISFGSLEDTITAATKSFTITNTGDADLTLGTATIPAPFAADDSGCTDAVLSAGQHCTVTVSLRPAAAAPAAYSATLRVPGNTGTVTIPVTATVIHRSIKVSSPTVNFGSLVVGTTASKSITVTNTGSVAWTYQKATATSGETKVTGGSCVTGHGAVVGGSCTLTLTFTPAAAGARSVTVTLEGNPSATVRVTAAGVAIRRTASISPSSVSWSAVVGTSSTRTVTVRNTGNVAWKLTARTLSASTPLAITGGTCTPGHLLSPNATCTVALRYHPTVAGSRTVILKVVDPAGTQQSRFTLTGIAVAKHLAATPSSVSFGTRTRGTTTNLTLTVRNTGNVSFVPGRPTVAAPFGVWVTTCTNAVAPGRTCTIRLSFRPTAAGSRTATLVLPGSSPALRVRVTGTGR